MKVRLLNLAVLAAIATGARAAAQDQGGSLERALADLNAGRVAPQGTAGTVTANASHSLNFGGDMRIRNTWLNEIGHGVITAPSMGGGGYGGGGGGKEDGLGGGGGGGGASIPAVDGRPDDKNIDARVRFYGAFDVSPDATAYVELLAHENWGTVGGVNAATQEGGGAFSSNFNSGSFNQAYFSGRNLILDGEEWTFGRKYYTLGSGRLLGTDDWDQQPDSFSGIWYTYPLSGLDLNVWMITDIFHTAGLNGRYFPPGDQDLFGATINWSTDAIEAIGTINIKPYIVRMTRQDTATGTKNWLGGELSGNISAVDYDAELVFVDSDKPSDPEISSYNAWAIDLGIRLGEWIQDIPGNINPRIELGAAAADNAGVSIDPVYHNTAGVFDFLNRGATATALTNGGGVWNGMADTWQGAFTLTPIEKWEGRVGYVHFNDNNESDAFEADGSEIDLSVSHTFHNNMALWLGWARVDVNGFDPNAYVIYGTLSLPF